MTAPAVALARATERLLAQQDAAGYWWGPMPANVTVEAEDLLVREALRIRTAQETEPTARWIRSQQRSDGTWSIFPGGPADLSATVEAYLALRLAGDQPGAPHMASVAEFCRRAGGLHRTRVITRFWLAVFGLWSWAELPVMPPELVLASPRAPISLYRLPAWIRMGFVQLAVLSAHHPTYRLPFGVDELRGSAGSPPRPRPLSWTGAFVRMDALLHRYERHPIRGLRRRALRAAEQWLIRRQEADGAWFGNHTLSVFSLLALHSAGYPIDHPVIRAGIAGLDRFGAIEDTPDGPARWVVSFPSHVWDTALSVLALADAGLPADHKALRRAADWLLGQEVRAPGDWQVRRPRLRPGAWSFTSDFRSCPDCDDTALVVMALRRVAHPADSPECVRLAQARRRGIGWLLGMQCRDGGWAAFDADNTSTLLARSPFSDSADTTDTPSADVVAHVVETLAQDGMADRSPTRRGVAWLLRAQEPDGSWFGRWGANHLYGTSAAVPALVAAGVERTSPPIRRAAQWLVEHQNADGGWGEDLRSYVDPQWRGRGESTPSQTAWALLGLHAAGVGSGDGAVQRGLGWLAASQREDGGWDEAAYTFTAFPGLFYLGAPLYSQVFPMAALGRHLRAAT